MVKIFGDHQKALLWIGLARKKLKQLKRFMSTADLPLWSRRFEFEDVSIEISSVYGRDNITIWAVSPGAIYVICHVGSDTGINGYTKKFYRLEDNKLVELSPTVEGSNYGFEGMSLLDDGKYFLDYDLNTYDDPDSYDYNFNPTGLIAEDGSGTAILKQSGKSGRFVLNQAFEDEIFQAYVNSVDGTDRSYLVPNESLTFRPYKIKGNPVFNRYTDDSAIYLHSRTTHDPSSLVLRNDLYNAGVAEGFGDTLFVINKLYEKQLEDGAKTESDINADANGTALFGATRHYTDKRSDQDVGRVKTFQAGGFNFAEPAVKEEYGAGTEQEVFNRCADGGNTCYFMRGNTVSGTQKDPYGNVLDPGFNTIANDVKLPFAFTEDALTYVRMRKNDDYSRLNTGLYVAGELIEESGWEDVLVFGDGQGGVQDAATGKWVAEQNGPIVVRKTCYTILHAHHDANFDAVLYKKTVYKGYEQDLLPYRKARVLGSQGQVINGQIKRTMIESEVSYHVAVNGAVTDLIDANDQPYKHTIKEYTLTAESTNGSGTNIYTWIDLPWMDVGYDKNGNLLDENNRQITRVFSTATKENILFAFDVWDAKSKHNLVYDDSNPSYKYLWADYDTGVTAYPPLVDTFSVEERRWMLFGKNGSFRGITPPRINGIDYQRVNGMLMVEV
jgi:hypothetical protein